MGYPNNSTTQILPTTGSLALTEISALSGRYDSGGIGPLTAPYKLSELGGQDTDISIAPNPIRFSQFRGAINYNYNYKLIITDISFNDNDTYPLFYYTNTDLGENSYSVISLSNISRLLTLKTKGSVADDTDTFVRRDSKLNCTITGLIDHEFGLWMQINNEFKETKIRTNTTVSGLSLQVNSKSSIFDQLISNVKQIAPGLVKTLEGDTTLDYFKTPTSATTNYIAARSNILEALNRAALNTSNANITYNVNYTNTLGSSLRFNIYTTTYETRLAPKCYLLGKVTEYSRGINWASASFSVDLSKYPINYGSEIKLFVGAGPAWMYTGYSFSNTDVVIDIINIPTSVYPDP